MVYRAQEGTVERSGDIHVGIRMKTARWRWKCLGSAWQVRVLTGVFRGEWQCYVAR